MPLQLLHTTNIYIEGSHLLAFSVLLLVQIEFLKAQVYLKSLKSISRSI